MTLTTTVNLDELSESSGEDDYSSVFVLYDVGQRYDQQCYVCGVSPKILQASTMEEAIYLPQAIEPGVNIAELCGGVGSLCHHIGHTQIIACWPNFDLITGVGLNYRKSRTCQELYRQTPRAGGSDGTYVWPFRTHGQTCQTCHS